MQQSFRSTTFQLRKAKERRAFNGETQVHPPCSRRSFLHTSLIAGAALALPIHLLASTSVAKPDFLVAHYHVHLSPQLSIEQAVKLGKDRQVGIVSWNIRAQGTKSRTRGTSLSTSIRRGRRAQQVALRRCHDKPGSESHR